MRLLVFVALVVRAFQRLVSHSHLIIIRDANCETGFSRTPGLCLLGLYRPQKTRSRSCKATSKHKDTGDDVPCVWTSLKDLGKTYFLCNFRGKKEEASLMEREHRVTEMPERINFRILFKDRPTFDHIIQLAPIGKRGRSPTAQGEH